MNLIPIAAQFGIGGRSTVLKALQWLIALLLLALVELVRDHGPGWLLLLVSVLMTVGVSVAIFTHVWFTIKDPSELRSERYLLRSQELRLLRGDSVSGAMEVDPTVTDASGRALEPSRE